SDVMHTEHDSVLTRHPTLIEEIKQTADRLEHDGADRGDLKLLASLRGRYRGVFDDRHDLAGLQAAAREVYEEVRVVGGELG
ncbi:MAG: hypothetical protein MK554_02970, partial [Planctomycetes bacterium]|nr:hypothetical protein [Planctomycetota bacterium]